MTSKKGSKVKEQMEFYKEDPPFHNMDLIEERYEIINGIRYDFLASPTLDHQLLVMEIRDQINKTCYSNGIVVVAPMDVHLDEENIIQPDIIFISHENADIIQNQKILGPPDLLVEILSPSTAKNDKTLKKDLYERFKIKEYWIVDPVHFTIDQYLLENDIYLSCTTYGLDDTLHSPNLTCISIELNEVFDYIRNRKR